MSKKEYISIENLSAFIDKVESNFKKIIFQASVYSLEKIGAEGTRELKQALSDRHGATPKSPDYENAPVGAPPFMHTGQLRNSVGHVVVGNEKEQYVKCGSGPGVMPVEYARALDEGLHPFVYIAEMEVNPDKFKEGFGEKFNQLVKNGAL